MGGYDEAKRVLGLAFFFWFSWFWPGFFGSFCLHEKRKVDADAEVQSPQSDPCFHKTELKDPLKCL